jgi:hypothetical protein
MNHHGERRAVNGNASKANQTPDKWGARVRKGAQARLERHAAQMETDPEYRQTVRHVMKSLAARPGPLGKSVRTVAAVHAVVAKAL